jgi:hypothetical protein
MIETRTEKEIRKQLEKLKRQKVTQSPFTERKNIAWHAAKQAFEWVLEEAEDPLTF